jgi:hypothetical protein
VLVYNLDIARVNVPTAVSCACNCLSAGPGCFLPDRIGTPGSGSFTTALCFKSGLTMSNPLQFMVIHVSELLCFPIKF